MTVRNEAVKEVVGKAECLRKGLGADLIRW